MGLLPDAVTYENIKKSKTGEATTSQYQDLDLQAQENTGQYLELVKETETSVKVVSNNLEISYENTEKERQNKSEPKNQSEQSQYEEFNTDNERKNEYLF